MFYFVTCADEMCVVLGALVQKTHPSIIPILDADIYFSKYTQMYTYAYINTNIHTHTYIYTHVPILRRNK